MVWNFLLTWFYGLVFAMWLVLALMVYTLLNLLRLK